MGLSVKAKVTLLWSFGGVMFIIGAVMASYWTSIFTNIMRKELALSEKSMSYNLWKDTPIPMYLSFYLFNWTNPEEFMDNKRKVKPIFTEHGPYVFRERRKKVNLQWNANYTVTFMQNRTWEFVPELSNGTLDDPITNINVAPLTAAYIIRHWNVFIKSAVGALLESMKERYYVTERAGNWLFDGYDDPVLKLANKLPLQRFGIHIPFDKFGWFYERNGTIAYDGVFNMGTGTDDMSHLGVLKTWNYTSQTAFFEGPCAMVNGSAGELFPPGRTKDKISLYATDMCRSLTMPFREEVMQRGLIGYRYHGDKTLLANSTDCADNWCFCGGECVPSGAVNVSKCRFGAPAFISYPHFYLADPSYGDAVEGMNPEKEKHQFILDLEPNMGIPLNVAARFQINILLQKIPGIKMYNDKVKIFFPMLWFEETATISPHLAGLLRTVLIMPALGSATFLGILGVGFVLLLIGAVIFVRNRMKDDDEEPLTDGINNMSAH